VKAADWGSEFVVLPKIPVAALQPSAHNRADFDAAWPRIRDLAHAAASRGAKLIVLPEATVPGYVLGSEPVDPGQLERAAADVREIARGSGATIVYGTAKIVDGHVYNAAVCVAPDGRELGHAPKRFLWHFDRRWFAPGATLRPIETPVGTLGVLVCADGRIPTIAATLAERGAQILVMPTAWVTSGRDPAALENVQADLMANVRARENGLPFVIANKCGVELASVAYCGKSAIIAADGSFVARGSETAEEIVFGEIAPAAPRTRPPDERIAPSPRASERERARFAFTTARAHPELERLAELAGFADCDAVFARDAASAGGAPAAIENVARGATAAPRACAEVAYAVVDDRTMHDPRGLVAERLGGIDLFVWCADHARDPAWQLRFARTRAAELRAYVLVFDGGGERAYAVDPDGAVVAGTFGAYRMASFAYDKARARATTVAPATDVLAGLRAAEAIRAEALVEAGAR
jgi:predicted amidohydrolase